MDAEIKKKIFDQMQRCLMNLVGGSGHLACYMVIDGTFRITETEQLGQGLTEYHFSAKTHRQSKFTMAAEDDQPAPPETIQGSIVLDEEFRLARDENGRIRLEPWRCLDILE